MTEMLNKLGLLSLTFQVNQEKIKTEIEIRAFPESTLHCHVICDWKDIPWFHNNHRRLIYSFRDTAKFAAARKGRDERHKRLLNPTCQRVHITSLN